MTEGPGNADRTIIDEIRRGLRTRADPEKAERMRAYMKSEMPYYGVHSPGQKRIFKEVFDRHPLASFSAWRDTVLALWREAGHREERYAAIALTGHRAYGPYRTPASLPLYEELIVTGAWWDFVDDVAVHRLGELLLEHPAELKSVIRGWARVPDMWKRRSAIICQVGLKERTDLSLLFECIEANAADADFFIRKAVGWALRAYAWVDSDAVARYVEAHDTELSPLSKREALKNVGIKGSRRA